ncbi:DUF4148 domain-containing protein [Paraburkholderia susongensis]|uniref:DUF4148 domain-containing protein n=1 Tax=Paraburkholderia susongensis TaxID=1515439 RepID=A0A1X7L4A5_9BURK|nr:DUF4148 domain-containing protein [Paraburkholderia susongensis]SMG48691.1 protein of unknown function [Paraburkholderia susongensis]
MNTREIIALPFLALAIAGFASAASAQGLTRAEVRQQLIQAEGNGSPFVTDTSYPDVSPVFAQQVAQQKLRDQSTGGATAGASEAGAQRVTTHSAKKSDCVGPVSFCTPYFGS